MTGGSSQLTTSLKYARALARMLCAASLAIPRHPGVLRHHECEGVANLHTPQILTRHGEYEYLAGIRRGLHPAARHVDRCNSALHCTIGGTRLDVCKRLRWDGCRDSRVVAVIEPVRVCGS